MDNYSKTETKKAICSIGAYIQVNPVPLFPPKMAKSVFTDNLDKDLLPLKTNECLTQHVEIIDMGEENFIEKLQPLKLIKILHSYDTITFKFPDFLRQ